MKGPDEARRAVQAAALRLRRDAQALATASPAARDAGLQARLRDLRRAVLLASRAGVAPGVIAADAGLETAVVERWIALDTFGDPSR